MKSEKELKYYDGLETVFTNSDLKLSDLESAAGTRAPDAVSNRTLFGGTNLGIITFEIREVWFALACNSWCGHCKRNTRYF